MTIVQYLSAFRVYSADVLFLALGVTLVTSLLKKTVLKKCPKKVFVFLPFALGILFYSAYRAVVTLSAIPFTSELTQTVEGGFACGCVATLYYVVYEQFLRPVSLNSPLPPAKEAETNESALMLPVTPLLEGIVADCDRARAAKELTDGSIGKTGKDLLYFVLETLRGYAASQSGVDPDEGELLLYAKTICEFFNSLNG